MGERKGADVMSNDDATERADKKALSGLPGPRSEAVSPLHGGPRPDAAARNPFASSDQIEAQRPGPDAGAESAPDDTVGEPVNQAASRLGGSGATAEGTSSGDGEGAPAKSASEPTSAFIDTPQEGGSNVGLIVVGLVAIIAVLVFFLR